MDTEKIVQDTGSYDLIGDVHGHAELLSALVEKLGYARKGSSYEHPKGRKLVFVGDLVTNLGKLVAAKR